MNISLTVGEKLPNGAEVLAFSATHQKIIVLAEWKNGGLPTPDGKEYITWQLDEKKNAYWGHYFSEFKDALEDFEGRR